MRTSRSIAAAFLLCLLAASAQQQQNAPLTPQAYKFETTSQLVIVNVSAKDRTASPSRT